MGKLPQPRESPKNVFNIDTFLGADLTNQPSYISHSRSPDCINMIRESSGKVRKWIGYHTLKSYPKRINGVHNFVDENGEKTLIHAGSSIYFGDTAIYEGAADEKSVSKQLSGKLFILDGLQLLVYYKKEEEYICVTAQSIAYIPTLFISKPPKGGGTPYEPINLLQPQKTESFLGNGTDKAYQLAVTEISEVTKVVKVTATGETTLKESTDYTVDKALGKVNFTAVHAPVVTGEDNIKITYSKDVEGYAQRINSCKIVSLYGLNGARDRLFVAGCDKFSNRDYYSQLNDGLYFGDLWYCIVGEDNSKIMGYSIVSDKLATHLDRSDDDTNIVLREGNLVGNEAAFKLSGSFQGSGAVSRYAFSVLETEPLFLTQNGVYAVTPSDVLGERFAQLRSYYGNGLLLKQDIKNSSAVTFDRFYILAVGEYLFALDGTQATRDNNEPYSNRQYSVFYRNKVNARCLWVKDNKLMFGTESGEIKEFYSNYSDLLNFNDDGQPIVAKWTTGEYYGKEFYSKKKFKEVKVLLASAPATGVKVTAKYDGISEVVMEYGADARYFTYSRLTYSKFTYKTDKTAQGVGEKMSIKPENKKIQFIFENGLVNEPFGLYSTVVKYEER